MIFCLLKPTTQSKYKLFFEFSFDKVDPRNLVVDGGLLVVSLQHRLGALGFLPLNKVQFGD